MIGQEKVICLHKLLLSSVISGEKEPAGARKGIVIEVCPDDLVDGTGDFVLAHDCHLAILQLDHGQLSSLLAADHVVTIHEADGEDVQEIINESVFSIML